MDKRILEVKSDRFGKSGGSTEKAKPAPEPKKKPVYKKDKK
tara:strand:- start:2121 stop:2243 length:123 start_codon:yes stop_codon:yes gene_type:complete